MLVLLAEPPRSSADLHFQVLGIPVRVHPLFWLIMLLLGAGPAQGTAGNPVYGRDSIIILLIWIGVGFVSILVHELGHALAAKKFGWSPRITLYGLGGLASYRPDRDEPKKQILVSLAGPAAGLLLCGLVLVVMALVGKPVQFLRGGPIGFGWFIDLYDNVPLFNLVNVLITINLFWSLVNLLPVYPLDGGQVMREVLTLRDPRGGMVMALQISIAVGICIAVLAFMRLNSILMAFMFGYFAYINYQILQHYRSGYGR